MLPVSTDFIEGVQSAAFAGEDVLSGFCPDEGLRLCVVLHQVVIDRVLEVADAGVTAAADAAACDLGEEALDQVEPGRTGGCEMQFEAGVFLQPGLHLGGLVGSVVVEHEMDVSWFEDRAIDAPQECQKLLRPVAGHAVADDHAGLHIERGEERGRAVALVIMRHRGGAALLQRQSRLGPVERLDLRLFIDAEHDGAVRWVEIKPDDIGDLLLEHRVVRHLESLHDMRLQPRLGPYPPYARRRNPHRLGHQRAAPMGGIGRRPLYGLGDYLQPCRRRQRWHPRRACLVTLEARSAFIKIALLPTPDRRLRRARPTHDLKGAMTICCRQNDLGPPDHLARRVAVGDQSLKLSTGGGAKVKADVITSHAPSITHPADDGNLMSGGEH